MVYKMLKCWKMSQSPGQHIQIICFVQPASFIQVKSFFSLRIIRNWITFQGLGWTKRLVILPCILGYCNGIADGSIIEKPAATKWVIVHDRNRRGRWFCDFLVSQDVQISGTIWCTLPQCLLNRIQYLCFYNPAVERDTDLLQYQ